MALILDDSLRSTAARPLPDSLVHSYNKRCFQNYEVAEQTLINKVLLPGEVAFAYYYDQLSPYGQSAIAAVGPLTHGSGNIIFKNSATIDAIKDDLMTTIADVNASINYLREDLLDSIDNALDHLDSSLDEVLEQFTGANNTYQLQINNIFNSIEESNTSIMNVVNTSFNSLHTLVTDNYNSLNELICDVSDGLFNKIETTESSILNYIRTVLSDGFGTAASDTEDLVEETSTSLNGIINTFKDEINNKIDTVNSSLTSGLGNLRIDVSNLQVDVSANKQLFEKLEHKYQHLLDTSSVENLVNSKLEDLQQLVDDTEAQLKTYNYGSRLTDIETQLSNILSYASSTLITNLSTDVSYLKAEDASIKHRFDHIMETVNASVNATIDSMNQSALETWERINASVNTTINAYTETIQSLVNDMSVLTAQFNKLLAKQNELEQEHIDQGTDIDDIENTTDEVYNLEPFIQELDNRLSK